MKTCKRCQEVKAKEDFTGRLCAPCYTIYQAEHYQANRERKLEAARTRRETMREENRTYAKEYRQEHSQKYRDALRSWRKNNPEKLAEYRMRRSARKRGATESKPYTRSEVWDKSDGLCFWCRLPMLGVGSGTLPNSFSIDHYVPLARGGSDTIENVVGAHFNCNQSHLSRLVEELPQSWFEERRHVMMEYTEQGVYTHGI